MKTTTIPKDGLKKEHLEVKLATDAVPDTSEGSVCVVRVGEADGEAADSCIASDKDRESNTSIVRDEKGSVASCYIVLYATVEVA